MQLNVLLLKMTTSISDIKDYYETMKSHRDEIATRQAKYAYEKLVNDGNRVEYSGASEESIKDDLIKTLYEFGNNSVLIGLNDKIEFFLRELCNAIKNKTNDTISFSDFYGNPIEKAQKYFLHRNERQIEEIKIIALSEITIIRNCIVHCSNRIDESKDKSALLKIISEDKGITCINGRLIVEDKYLDKIIDNVVAIMNGIFLGHGWGNFLMD
jgi:hypothetical protein